jgi:type IV secretion system protein VirD4
MTLKGLSPRQIWNAVIYGGLALGLLILGWSVIADIIHVFGWLGLISDAVRDDPQTSFASDFFYVIWDENYPGTLGLFLDGWAIWLIIQCRKRRYTLDPTTWLPFGRLSLLLLGILTVIGLPLTRLLYGLGQDAGGVFSLVKIVLIPALLPLAGALTISGLVAVFALPFAVVQFLVTGLPMMIVDMVHEFIIDRHIENVKKERFFGQVSRFSLWLRGEPLPELPPDDSKGARFATDGEIANLERVNGAAFGHNRQSGHPLKLYTDKHVLIMASTRSGKGVTLIIPHLLRYEGSAFVLDPKGENARATGRQRAALNDKVHYLDPFGISGKPRSRFNPFARFTLDNMEAESKALASALVLGERDHWTSSAQQLLAAIILYVFVPPDLPPEKKDLVTVRRFLLGAVPIVLKDMVKSKAADGLLAALAQSFIDTPEKEFGSILSTAQRETEILDNPFIAKCLAAAGDGEEVDFADWHSGTMTVFLCLSAPKFPVFNRWLRLVLTSALDEMTDTLRPPPEPVCFMLDELATLGHLATVENAIGLAAGYGVQIFSVFQDVAQMRDLYKGRWASFIGNAGIRALFNLDDFETAEYWSKFIGGHLVESTSSSLDIYGLSRGETASETMRPLLSPDEIMMHFAANNMLILPQGSRPIVTQRVPYFIDPTLAGLWDDPRGPIA